MIEKIILAIAITFSLYWVVQIGQKQKAVVAIEYGSAISSSYCVLGPTM